LTNVVEDVRTDKRCGRVQPAQQLIGAGRVTLWGALAMAATAAIGRIFGTIA